MRPFLYSNQGLKRPERLDGKVVIHERKKVYVLKVAELELKVGDNRARAEIDLESGEMEFNI